MTLTRGIPADPDWTPFTPAKPTWLAFQEDGSVANESLADFEKDNLGLSGKNWNEGLQVSFLLVNLDCSV